MLGGSSSLLLSEEDSSSVFLLDFLLFRNFSILRATGGLLLAITANFGTSYIMSIFGLWKCLCKLFILWHTFLMGHTVTVISFER